MHPLLGLSSLFLVLLGSCFILGALRNLHDWPWRRHLQITVLAAPLISMGVGINGLYHFSGRTCFTAAAPWDYTLGAVVPLAMGLVAAGGLGLGLVRHTVAARAMGRRSLSARPDLQESADRLCEKLGVPRCRLFVRIHDRPLAITHGLHSPTLLISSWMVEHLDQRELESVLAHELAHVARRDYLAVLLATVLRDTFFYLPTSWVAYRQLQREKEIAADDLAAGATGRPLALASALGKVWHLAASGSSWAVQSLVGESACMESRIERLLRPPRPAACARKPRSWVVIVGAGGSVLTGLLALETLGIVAVLTPMDCGPVMTLLRAL